MGGLRWVSNGYTCKKCHGVGDGLLYYISLIFWLKSGYLSITSLYKWWNKWYNSRWTNITHHYHCLACDNDLHDVQICRFLSCTKEYLVTSPTGLWFCYSVDNLPPMSAMDVVVSLPDTHFVCHRSDTGDGAQNFMGRCKCVKESEQNIWGVSLNQSHDGK